MRRLSQNGSFFTQKQAEHEGSDANNLNMKMVMMMRMVVMVMVADGADGDGVYVDGYVDGGDDSKDGNENEVKLLSTLARK